MSLRAFVRAVPPIGWSFAIRSLAVFAAVWVVGHVLISGVLTDHYRGTLDFHAEFVVGTIVEPLLTTDPEPQAALADLVERDSQVVAIDVVQTGADAPPNGSDDGLDAQFVSSTVPVSTASGPATVHVIQDASATREAQARMTSVLDAILLGGLVVLWIALLPLVNRVGRRLHDRTVELEERSVELQHHLGHEQETVARLEELSELKDRFLTAISHELRTPLTVVTGMLETIRRHDAELTTERRADLVERARRSSVKLRDLLDGLLDLGPESERPALREERVDVEAVTRDAVAHLPPRPLVFDLEVGHLVTDATRLRRILTNLVGNAIRHAPGDEPVLVRTVRCGDAVALLVADRGPGIADELKQAIFEPFRQGPIADEHSPGVGVGLALVARMANELGGQTWVEDRPGGGARFHVRIPQPIAVSAAVG